MPFSRSPLRAWEPVFAAVNVALGAELAERLHGPEWRVHHAAEVKERLESQSGTTWLAEVDDTLVGFASARIVDPGRGSARSRSSGLTPPRSRPASAPRSRGTPNAGCAVRGRRSPSLARAETRAMRPHDGSTSRSVTARFPSSSTTRCSATRQRGEAAESRSRRRACYLSVSTGLPARAGSGRGSTRAAPLSSPQPWTGHSPGGASRSNVKGRAGGQPPSPTPRTRRPRRAELALGGGPQGISSSAFSGAHASRLAAASHSSRPSIGIS